MAIVLVQSMTALAMALMLVGGVSAQTQGDIVAPSGEERYVQLQRTERDSRSLSEREQSSAIVREYDRLFSSTLSTDVMKKASTEDLTSRLKAATLAEFYSHDREHLTDMQRDFSELERKGAIKREQVEDMLHALLAQREFDDARKLSVRLAGMHDVSIPVVRTSGMNSAQLNAYAVEDDADVLTTANVDISKGSHLIIISHPLCGFSRNAHRDLSEDPSFASVLSSEAIWLAPVSGRLNLESIRQWNRERPNSQILLARDRASWPIIESWATPQFYAVRDGVVVGAISGWPKEGRKTELAALLHQLEEAANGDVRADSME